jgi:hypothetical protein
MIVFCRLHCKLCGSRGVVYAILEPTHIYTLYKYYIFAQSNQAEKIGHTYYNIL